MAQPYGCCVPYQQRQPFPWFGDLLWSRLARCGLACLSGYAYSSLVSPLPVWHHVFGSPWNLVARSGPRALTCGWVLLGSPTQHILAIAGTTNEAQILAQMLSLTIPPVGSPTFSSSAVYDVAATALLVDVGSQTGSLGSLPLTIVGHSAGGSVGYCVARKIRLAHPSLPIAWASLGSPRSIGIGSRDFLNRFPHFAVVGAQDAVGFIPPSVFDWAFILAPVPLGNKVAWALYDSPPSVYTITPSGTEGEYFNGGAQIAVMTIGILSDWLIHNTWARFANHSLSTYLTALQISAFAQGLDTLNPWANGHRIGDLVAQAGSLS